VLSVHGGLRIAILIASSLGSQAGFARAPAQPTPTSAAAATATAADNALCTAIEPFYWEIGDKTQRLVSGSVGVQTDGNPIVASTELDVASAAKWVYGTYIVEIRGGATELTANDIQFLTFLSGYTNMGNAATVNCPSTDSPDTVNTCLLRLNPANGLPYDYQNPATIGAFDYDSGHIENHASLYGGLGTVVYNSLGSVISAQLGPGVSLAYTEPLLAGGIHTDATQYGLVLRHILSGSLAMLAALGQHAVCTLPSTTCAAIYSPIPEAWHYSIAHWVEDDPNTNGDGAFSSPGALGFYPWIEAGKKYYGLISRANNSSANEGYYSAECGRLIRAAWDTGVQQTGTLPNKPPSTKTAP